MKDHNYFVYICTNSRKSVLYTGVTNDLYRRMLEHKADSEGAKKTSAGKYNCFNLLYYEFYTEVNLAIQREKYIKGITRKKKWDLIESFNPDFRVLNQHPYFSSEDYPYWTFEKEDNKPW